MSAIVSLSSILTASAVQLAGDVAPKDVSEMKVTVPDKCDINFNHGTGGSGTGQFLKCNYEEKNFSQIFKSNDAFGIVSYYAYGVFKVQSYKEINEANLSTVKDALSLSVNLLMSIIMFLMFFLIIVALVFALFTRALYLWAIAVFSPLLSLRYFFEGKLG